MGGTAVKGEALEIRHHGRAPGPQHLGRAPDGTTRSQDRARHIFEKEVIAEMHSPKKERQCGDPGGRGAQEQGGKVIRETQIPEVGAVPNLAVPAR